MSSLIRLSVEFWKAPPKSSLGRHASRLLDWVVFGHAHPCFFWLFGFRGSMEKLFYLFPSWDMSYGPWWSQRWRMTWKPSFWWLAIVVKVFVAIRNFLGDLWLVAATSASGGSSVRAVQSPALQDENPRSDLNWLCMAIALLKATFCERELYLGWKPMIYDHAMTMLVHRFLPGGIAIREVGLLVLYWWCL
jgi:hypothetical protein